MKNILVPTDFSETSRNAARYAAHLGAAIGGAHIVLYNLFESFEAGSDSSPLQDDMEDRRAIRMVALQNIQREMDPDPSVQVECRAQDGSNLVHAVKHVVASEGIDLMVVGITGATRLAQILIGSNTLRLLRHAICPVLVIPPEAGFSEIKKMAFATDLDKETESLPWKSIHSIIKLFRPDLHVVHINDRGDGKLPDNQLKEKAALENALAAYRPSFHEVRQGNFIHAINQFVIDNQINMLITVPAKISYLSDLFRNTHTEKLGFYSHVPFIAIPE